MKYFVLIVLLGCFLSCSLYRETIIKNNENPVPAVPGINNSSEPEEMKSAEIPKTMYVNFSGGVTVKSNPEADAKPSGFLEHMQIVKIISIEPETAVIDTIEGNWALVESAETRGWVVTGYLSGEEVSSGFDVTRNSEGHGESIVFPNGNKLDSRSFYNSFFLEVDTIRLYTEKDDSSPFIKIINSTAMISEVNKADNWLYIVTIDMEHYGYIKVTDITEKTYYGDLTDSKGNNYRALQQKEHALIRSRDNIKRYGPLLLIDYKGKTVRIWDILLEGNIWSTVLYCLVDIDHGSDILLSAHYYEGGRYCIFNLETEQELAVFNSLPVFNDDRSYFASLGAMHGELPVFEMYEAGQNDYTRIALINVNELFDMDKNRANPGTYNVDDYITSTCSLEWENNKTLHINYADLGRYTLYYENGKWNEQLEMYTEKLEGMME